MDIAGRLPRLRQAMAEAECDGLLVTSLTNIRYLCGFTGSAGLLWVGGDEALFVSDGRYRTQAADEIAQGGAEVRVEIPATADGQREAVAAAAGGAARVGLEAGDVTWARVQTFDSEWFPDASLVPTGELVEQLRLVKDAGEVQRIELACAIADVALTRVRGRLLDEPTEAEFGLELDTEMRRLGAADLSFETIVAAGPNGAKPHARPSNRRITDGDLVVCDFGAMVDGYHSDMTRTFWVGEPTALQRRMWEVVEAAQAAGVAAVRAGATVAEVDKACRAVIDEAGWSDAFVHSTGHGVGLDIHEAPRVAGTVDATLATGYVVTVEPGVYLPPHGGVRIEDIVVVTDDGCRRLTSTPRVPHP
ncbi:MAG: aminopeptidase P family protein [Acidimicrobiia bacterium]|nr:aminopeptidase P family protein [Acidimicrobiia bacterium]